MRAIKVGWVCALLLEIGPSLAESQSPIAASRFQLSIDGMEIAPVKAPQGQAIEGLTNPQRAAAAVASNAPMSLQLDAGVAPPLFTWLTQTFAATEPPKRTLEVLGEGSKLAKFHDAVITEITFPSMEANSKTPVFLGVKIVPSRLEFRQLPGKAKRSTAQQPRRWLASNFRLELGGLPASAVSKIDSFTMKQGVVNGQASVQASKTRVSREPAAKPRVPSLKVTVASAHAATLTEWRTSQRAKSGTLTLVDAEGRRWARLELGDVRVQSLKPAGRRQVTTLSVGSVKLLR